MVGHAASVDRGKMLATDVERFHKEGYLIVPDLFTNGEVVEWKRALQERIKNDDLLDEGAGVRVWFCHEMDELTTSHVTSNPKMRNVLQHIIGPNVEFLSVKAVFKNATTNFQSPWHQDWHYWHGSTKISVWIALDDATQENGCLRLIPRSHNSIVEMEDVQDGKGFVHRIPEGAVCDQPVTDAVVRAGDAIFFHDLTLHASCPNLNGKDRWSAIATYRDASKKDESTIWKSSILLSGESVNFTTSRIA